MLRKLNVNAIGLSFGLTWAGAIFILGVLASFGYGVDLVSFLSELYIGYEATLVGSILGAIWAFAYAYIVGVVIASFYNKFSR